MPEVKRFSNFKLLMFFQDENRRISILKARILPRRFEFRTAT